MARTLEILLTGIFCVYLFRAAVEDHRFCRVRRYLWWVAGSAGMGLFLLLRGMAPKLLLGLLLYGILQFAFFSRAYGKADCHAFLCCAIVLAAHGGGWEDYLWHGLFTFLLLGIRQLQKGNVSARGNLKKPVALIPYVTASFFLSALKLIVKGVECGN